MGKRKRVVTGASIWAAIGAVEGKATQEVTLTLTGTLTLTLTGTLTLNLTRS